MENVNTSSLVNQAINGDMSAFEELIIDSEKIVYNIAFRMLADAEDAKDISQEVFIKVYKNLSKFDGKAAFSTWVYRIAVNTCIDEMRKRKGKQNVSIDEELKTNESSLKKQYIDKEPTPEESFMQKETEEEIMSAMEKLSIEHKAVITLRDLDGLSYSEIADITEVSMGTVKSRLARARLQLKNIIVGNKEHIAKGNRQNN